MRSIDVNTGDEGPGDQNEQYYHLKLIKFLRVPKEVVWYWYFWKVPWFPLRSMASLTTSLSFGGLILFGC
jgi:hypothetical protein